MQAHDLTAVTFKIHHNPRDTLGIKGSQYANQLVAEVGDDIQVEVYFIIDFRLAKEVIIYQAGSETTVRNKRGRTRAAF